MTHTAQPDPTETDPEPTVAVPVRLVRGHASPEDLSAVIAVIAVLSNDSGQDESDTDRTSRGGGKYPRSPWSSPTRLVRSVPPHGPGGWRASGLPR
jgi:hypothetical protein